MRQLIAIGILMLSAPLFANSFDDQLNQGIQLLEQGLYHQAQDTLEHALELPSSAKDRVMGPLGETHYAMHHFSTAESLLSKALESASSNEERSHYASLLGNLHFTQHHTDLAQGFYQQALALTVQPEQRLRIELNRNRLLPARDRLKALKILIPQLNALTIPQQRARLALNLGEQARTLGSPGLAMSYEMMETARRLTETGPPNRLAAEALASIGRLYEQQQRFSEALELTQRAIRQLQNQEAHDLLLDLEWQQGRLYQQLQQSSSALMAYQRAVDHIEAIRLDIPVEYHNGHSSFRETLEPIYLGFAELLLQQTHAMADGPERQQQLRRVRDTVERLKQTELEDFLGDRCLIESRRGAALDKLAAHTAVLYPIVFHDHLELLLGIDERWYPFRVDVNGKFLRHTTQMFAQALRFQQAHYQDLSQRLYHWLINPLETILHNQNINTLIIVPDGVLRLINFATLQDGPQFVLEKYAVATVPALTLFDNTPLRNNGQTLIAGLSEPGPVVDKLPINALQNLVDNPSNTPHLSLTKTATRGLNDVLRDFGNLSQLEQTPERHSQLAKLLTLPGVKQEVQDISQQGKSTLLLNHAFTLQNFKQELLGNAYSVIHIASHGFFSSKADDSFLMTYDDLLKLDELENLLRSVTYRNHPVDLITLSACQTAAGDDRAPLGFSGVALKARAHSALGSLWPISDHAAQNLMSHFYQNLGQTGISKVEALRQAQLTLLHNPDFAHPFYWSPFMIIGNWL